MHVLENKVKVMMYNIRRGAIRWQILDVLSDGNSNIFIFPVFTLQNKLLQKFDLENLD